MAKKKSTIAEAQTTDDAIASIAAAFGLPTGEVALTSDVNEETVSHTDIDPVEAAPLTEDEVPDFLKGDASHVQAEQARANEAIEEAGKSVEATGVGFDIAGAPAVEPSISEEEDTTLTNSGGLTRKDFDKEVRKLGTALGQGKNSMPALALRTLEALGRVVDMNPNDKTLPEVIFNEFMAKASAASGLERGEMSSYKVQLSKFKQFFAASHPGIDAYGMMIRALDIIKELQARDDAPLKSGTYEAMVSVARAQKAVKDRELYDTEIEGALITDKPEKSELERLGDLLKKVRKAHDWAPQGAKPGIEDAAHNIEDAIRALGGAIPGEAEPATA